MPMHQNYNQNPQLIEMLQKQNDLISGINNRLALIEEEPDQEENETETEAVIGRIETLLNHPVLNLVLGLVAPKISEFMKPQTNMVTALAGVENTDNKSDENLLIEALDLLSKKVENLPLTLHKLAIYAEKNPSQFNMLVSML